RARARSRPLRWSGTALPRRSGLRCRPWSRKTGTGGWPAIRPRRRPSGSARSWILSSPCRSPVRWSLRAAARTYGSAAPHRPQMQCAYAAHRRALSEQLQRELVRAALRVGEVGEDAQVMVAGERLAHRHRLRAPGLADQHVVAQVLLAFVGADDRIQRAAWFRKP